MFPLIVLHFAVQSVKLSSISVCYLCVTSFLTNRTLCSTFMVFVVSPYVIFLLCRIFVIKSLFVKNWLFACCALLLLCSKDVLCALKISFVLL